ncbi:CBS domain-containing protein [Rhizobium sp. CRIBSB]|nr:CBS domain-containing protein [Rhizobium sp. CRIBSB]
MLVAEILKTKGPNVFAIGPSATMAEACGELRSRGVGALVVCDQERVVGVLSERDVVGAVARDGAAGLERPVSHYMTGKVIFAEPGETVAVLMSRMTDRRIRHLPVLSDEVLVGVISIGDLVKCQIAEATHEAEAMRSYIAAG